ncbi:MAG: hypothetical protein RIS20_2268 [Bacteroidota bacterium]|jgi:hypothetical protein
MKSKIKTKKDFSITNWEIATTIVGAQLLLDIDPGEMNLEKVQKEIIEDVFFSKLLNIGQERVNSGDCDEEEIEVYKSIALNTVVIKFMLEYTSVVKDSHLNLESISQLDLLFDENGANDYIANLTFSTEEEKQIAHSFYSNSSSIAHEIMNNEEVMNIIVTIYKLLISDVEMKKKHLLVHKTLVELKFINFN